MHEVNSEMIAVCTVRRGIPAMDWTETSHDPTIDEVSPKQHSCVT